VDTGLHVHVPEAKVPLVVTVVASLHHPYIHHSLGAVGSGLLGGETGRPGLAELVDVV